MREIMGKGRERTGFSIGDRPGISGPAERINKSANFRIPPHYGTADEGLALDSSPFSRKESSGF